MLIRCFEDANDHTMHKFSLSIMINGIILIWCVFLPADLFELQVKKTHVFKVTNFMNNLKITELLTFLHGSRTEDLTRTEDQTY